MIQDCLARNLEQTRPCEPNDNRAELERIEAATKIGLRASAIPDIKLRARSIFKISGGSVVAVDTDAPKHLVLRFPGFSEPFTDDPALLDAHWADLLSPPTPAHTPQD